MIHLVKVHEYTVYHYSLSLGYKIVASVISIVYTNDEFPRSINSVKRSISRTKVLVCQIIKRGIVKNEECCVYSMAGHINIFTLI